MLKYKLIQIDLNQIISNIKNMIIKLNIFILIFLFYLLITF